MSPLMFGLESIHSSTNQTNNNLAVLMNIILDAYFINSYCTTIISNDDICMNDLNIPTVNIKSDTRTKYLKDLLLQSWELGCTDSVIHMWDPMDAVDMFEYIVHASNHRKGDRKIIIILTKPNLKPIQIFRDKSLEFIPNILIIGRKEERYCEIFNLITHKYTGFSECNDVIMLDEWSSCSGFKYGNNLFPHDMNDLMGKVVKLAVFQYEPYVFLNIDRSVAPEGYDGTEMRIVIEFCRWLNCTLELVIDEKHEWGEIFDNHTGNGVIGAVAMDKADLGITALYSWYHEYTFLDLSMPAIRTGITCLVPSPTLIPGWRLAIMPFTVETWISVGGVVLTLIFVLWFSSNSSFHEATFISYRLMIMQCGKEQVQKTLRILIIWYVLAGMLLDASYSGSLASFLTVPRYGVSIETVEDLKNSGIEWGATHDAWIFSIASSKEPTMEHLVSNFKKMSEQELMSKGKSGKFAFSIERLPAGHYAVGDYIQEDAIPYLQLMHEDIYWEQCLMMARKSSPYTKKYNQLLSRLHSSGILLGWETQVVQKYSDMDIQIGVRYSHHQYRHTTSKPLAFSKVLGAFTILAIGYGMSIFVFLLELSSRRTKVPPSFPKNIS